MSLRVVRHSIFVRRRAGFGRYAPAVPEMTNARVLSLIAICCLCVSCTSQSVPPPAEAPAPAPPPPKPDLSPVAIPKQVLLTGRVRNLSQTATELGKHAGNSLPFRKPLSKLFLDLSAVRWDAPLEFAVAFESEPQSTAMHYAYSAGLVSLEAALAAARARGLELVKTAPGVYGVLGAVRPCAIAPALGSTRARLVCGSEPEALRSLLPYLTRGLPSAQLPEADLVANVHFDAIRDHWSRETVEQAVKELLAPLGNKNESFDRMLGLGALALSSELTALAGDLSSTQLQIDHDAQSVTLKASATFRDTNSWTANALLDPKQTPVGIPAGFEDLPRGTHSAVFYPGLAQERSQVLRRYVVGLLAGLLDFRGGPESGQQALLQLFETWPVPEQPVIVARGEASPRAKPGAKARGEDSEPVPWFLLKTDVSAETLTTWLKRVGNTLTDNVVAPQLRRLLNDADADPIFKLKPRSPRRWKLPKGTVAFDVGLTDPKKTTGENLVLLIVPNRGDSSLLVAAREEKLAADLVSGLHGKTTNAHGSTGQKLGKQPAASASNKAHAEPNANTEPQPGAESKRAAAWSFDLLHQPGIIAGGYSNLSPLLRRTSFRAAVEASFGYSSDRQSFARSMLERVPGRGRSPLAFGVFAKDKSLHLHMRLSNAALSDLLHWLELLRSEQL